MLILIMGGMMKTKEQMQNYTTMNNLNKKQYETKR